MKHPTLICDFIKWYLSIPSLSISCMYNSPQQTFSTDSGIFVMILAEIISRKGKINFSQQHISTLRLKILYELIHHTIVARISHPPPPSFDNRNQPPRQCSNSSVIIKPASNWTLVTKRHKVSTISSHHTSYHQPTTYHQPPKLCNFSQQRNNMSSHCNVSQQ